MSPGGIAVPVRKNMGFLFSFVFRMIGKSPAKRRSGEVEFLGRAIVLSVLFCSFFILLSLSVS